MYINIGAQFFLKNAYCVIGSAIVFGVVVGLLNVMEADTAGIPLQGQQ